MTLLSWEITSVRVTGLSRDKFTMGNIHGYVKNSKETAYNIKLGKKQGFLIPKAKQPIRFLQHETPQNCFFKTGFFRTVERKIDGDMADFTLR